MITTVLPLNRLMNGRAAEKMLAFPIVDAIRGFAAWGVVWPVTIAPR